MVTSVVPTSTAFAIAGVDAGVLSVISIVLLVILLIAKEFVSSQAKEAGPDSPSKVLSASLNAPILALLCVFLVLVVVKVWEVL